MNSKERVIKTINHKKPDRVPLDGWFNSRLWANLKDHFKLSDDEDILERLGIDLRPVVMDPAPDFRKDSEFLDFVVEEASFSGSDYICRKVDERLYEDEWGIQIKLNEDEINWSYTYHPLGDLSLKHLRIPDLSAPGRLDRAKKKIDHCRDKFVFAGVSTCFRRGWLLTGFTKFLEAQLLDRTFVEKLLDPLLEFEIKEVKMYVDLGVNMIELLGDLGTEESLFLSPELWREIFKPRMKAVIDSVKKSDVYFFLHSDGNIEEIIPDLIEIGINVLNPIQPECMDTSKIKEKYGEKLTLHGTMSLQRTLAFGTPDDVIKEAKSRIEDCGYNGGLVLAPSNVLTDDIPIENIVTFYDYVRDFKL